MPEFSSLSTTKGKSLFLFLEDDGKTSPLADMLWAEGFIVHCFQELPPDAIPFEKLQPDLVLIDRTSPSMELISTCRFLRHHYSGPILFLAGQIDEIFQILGLEMGVDDFLIKPLTPALLLAKVRALLRRNFELRQTSQAVVHLGELVIDAGRREVQAMGRPIELTTREFDLLWCLAANNRKVLTRDDIHKSLYNSEYNGFSRSIDIYISRIRQKIGDDPQHPRYLKTVRGAGYLLTEDHPQ